jgi:hypothetical protein
MIKFILLVCLKLDKFKNFDFITKNQKTIKYEPNIVQNPNKNQKSKENDIYNPKISKINHSSLNDINYNAVDDFKITTKSNESIKLAELEKGNIELSKIHVGGIINIFKKASLNNFDSIAKLSTNFNSKQFEKIKMGEEVKITKPYEVETAQANGSDSLIDLKQCLNDREDTIIKLNNKIKILERKINEIKSKNYDQCNKRKDVICLKNNLGLIKNKTNNVLEKYKNTSFSLITKVRCLSNK